MSDNLKTMVHFLFRPHTNSLKQLISLFDQGWPGWKWITNCKRSANVFKFCARILQKKIEKLIMVCSTCENSLDTFLLVLGSILHVNVSEGIYNFRNVLKKREILVTQPL